ncbi:MAG: exo-alpha-sialidase [Pirellulales bacterium]|nr:exo-alpha-sialidase [Pirellulales bacterium]
MPQPGHTQQPRQTRAVDVFVGGVGYANYRVPTLATALDGTLIALVEGRTGEEPGFGGDTDLVMKRSYDHGATWSALQVIESPRAFGEKVANPATLVDETNGRVWVLYNRYEGDLGTVDSLPGTTNNTAWARYSDDSGATWSDAIDITAGAKDYDNWNVVAFGPGSGIQARDGRLIVPSARWVNGWRSYAVYSDDQGMTWQRGDLTPGGNLSGEDSIVELADGSIRMDARSNNSGEVPRSNFISTDGGETWGAFIPGQTAVSVHAALQRYSLESEGDDHNRIMWTGPRGPDRNNLVVRTSYDEGNSYWRERLLYDGYSGYSDMTLLANDMTGVLFETNQARSITFTSFNIEFIEPPSGLLAYEGFRYQSATLLGIKDGGIGFRGGWKRTGELTGTSNALIEASDLQYAGFPFITEGQRRAVLLFNVGGSMSREFDTPLDLGLDQTYYLSMLIRQDNLLIDNEGPNEAFRVALQAGESQVVEFGVQGNESLFVSFLGNQSATGANVFAKGISYYLIAKIAAEAGAGPGSNDRLYLAALPSGTEAPATEAGMNWTLASSLGFNSSELLDRILISGGSGATWVLDELRIGSDFGAVVSNRFEGEPGDFNGDGSVDAADLAVWNQGFGMSADADFSYGDANGDSKVDGSDFLVWQRKLTIGTSPSSPSAAAPEPTACAMLAVAIMMGGGAVARRDRRR